eukprot:s268_g14.t2
MGVAAFRGGRSTRPSVMAGQGDQAQTAKPSTGCGQSIVQAADAGKHEAVIQHLQQDPERVRMADRDGLTALHHVARKGNSLLAKDLLRYGADVKATDQWGMTPLHRAVVKGHAAVVEQLLHARAELRAKNARGLTAADFAKAHNDDKIREILASFASQ